jgi:pyruvate,water dikinase
MHDLVVSLMGLGRGALAVAGGKAANLGELLRAGLPVPPGFCVTTAAYRAVALDPSVRAAIERLAAVERGDAAGLAAGATAVREALRVAPVPAEIREACARAYVGLGAEVVVAVRSSATAEDLPDASFAGQQDTLLGVRGEAAVLAAIRRCWASLFSERAVAYRAPRGIAPDAVELAVVVQALVPASVAGVLFTADPLSGRRHRAVIDASPGLGEAVVSGAVNPDHFEVEHRAVVVRRIGDKRLRIDAEVAADGVSGTRQVEVAASETPCVSDAELHALVALGERIAAHFGAPQDIEWALDADRRPAILQARPITTLYPLPPDAPAGPELAVYLNFNVAQGVFQPLTPMGVQCWRLFTGAVARNIGFDVPVYEGPPFVHEGGHRLLFDITTPLRHPLGRKLALAVFSRMEARSAAVLRHVVDDPRLAAREGSWLELAKVVLRGMWRTRAPLRLIHALRDPASARAQAWARAEEVLALGDVPANATAEARLAAMLRMILVGFPQMFLTAVPTFGAGLLCLLVARRLLGGLATAQEIEATLRALPFNPTTEMDLELWAGSRRIAADPESSAALLGTARATLVGQQRAGTLPPVLQAVLDGFMRKYGARGVAEIDVGVARWGEDPEHVIGALTNYLAQDRPELAPDLQFERGRGIAEAMIGTLVGRARAQGRVRGALVKFAFDRMRALAGMREAPKFFIVRVLDRGRRLLQEIGATLQGTGRLSRADDVFMLTLPELRSALQGGDVRPIVFGRRASFERERERRHLPRVLLSDGTDAETLLPAPTGDALTGTPASAGRVTGLARVVMDPSGARIEPGEILVAPSTDPGWTPLFLTASGLVMEMGGAMSHGSVVAREYGIPAVVGVAHATARIVTGQRITVDGGAGTVTVEVDEQGAG